MNYIKVNINPLYHVPLPETPSIIIDTGAFINEIKSKQKDITDLLKINTLKTCLIVFTPCIDIEAKEVLLVFQADIASYDLQNQTYILKTQQITIGISNETDPVFLTQFKEDTGMEHNDHMALSCHCFHYSVSNRHKNSLSLSQIIDVLQVYHVKNKIFEGYDWGELEESFYYMNKTNLQIPNYKKFWIELCHLKSAFKDKRSIIEELGQSLHDRVSFMNKAIVELKYHSLKTVTNSASTDIMYHLSYFIILITGSYDNVAWILNYVFDLECSLDDYKSRICVTLSKPQSIKSNNKFYTNFPLKAPVIAEYLLKPEIAGFINFIYPLREAIQHRSFIKPLTVNQSNNLEKKLLICFPTELTKKLKLHFNPIDFGYDEDTSKLIRRDYYNIYIFSKKVHFMFLDLVNTVLGMIDLPKLLRSSDQEMLEINKAMENYKKDPWVGFKAQNSIIY